MLKNKEVKLSQPIGLLYALLVSFLQFDIYDFSEME